MLDVSTVHHYILWYPRFPRGGIVWREGKLVGGDDDVIVSVALYSESHWNESSTLHCAMRHFSSTSTPVHCVSVRY